jgi:hypothetical protein
MTYYFRSRSYVIGGDIHVFIGPRRIRRSFFYRAPHSTGRAFARTVFLDEFFYPWELPKTCVDELTTGRCEIDLGCNAAPSWCEVENKALIFSLIPAFTSYGLT